MVMVTLFAVKIFPYVGAMNGFNACEPKRVLRLVPMTMKAVDERDDLQDISLAVIYEFRRWLTFNLGYTYSDRDSNQDVIDFDQNIYRLTAKVTL